MHRCRIFLNLSATNFRILSPLFDNQLHIVFVLRSFSILCVCIKIARVPHKHTSAAKWLNKMCNKCQGWKERKNEKKSVALAQWFGDISIEKIIPKIKLHNIFYSIQTKPEISIMIWLFHSLDSVKTRLFLLLLLLLLLNFGAFVIFLQ